MTFHTTEFTIAMRDPFRARSSKHHLSVTVSGWLSDDGNFGIHHIPGTPKIADDDTPDDYYKLTHVPTGRSFGSLAFLTLEDAQHAAERFAALPADWTSTDPAIIVSTKGSRELYHAMRDRTKHRAFHLGIPLGRDYADPHATI